MPTYPYECEDCGNRFEEFQNMSDAPLRECPKCKGKVNRLITEGGGFILKKSASLMRGSACNLEQPCCGRDSRCDTRSCDQ